MIRTGATNEKLPAPGGAQSGFTLVELLIVVALLAILAALGASSLAAHTGRERAAALVFNAELNEARSLAAISGNGATVFVAPLSSGSLLTVFAGRPSIAAPGLAPDRGNPALVVPTGIALSIDGSAFYPTFALFVSSSGSVSALADYTVRQALAHPLAAEPPCDASVPNYLTVALAYATPRVTKVALPCAFGRPNFGQP